MNKYEALKRYFGYDSFRNGQEKLIDAMLSGKDALGIMPTGGGKSICYQIPAIVMPGITFVVSPLISLMKDQVMQLKAAGISAAFINSTLNGAQIGRAYENLLAGKYKIVYVAPERLDTPEFLRISQKLNISMIAVDEAHCISQWGQDFRPSYLKIAEYLNIFPKRPTLSAFTATATEKVRQDIIEILRLENPQTVVTGFDRTNLFFDVMKPQNKQKAVFELIKARKNKCGIVYCATRKNTDRLCEALLDSGVSAAKYHAGLTDEERMANQEDFLYDRKNVMVATNAFGMGINKSNVNYVIHYNMPKSLEEYYQEAGRAGRDGENAECILLYSSGDIITAKGLIGGEEFGYNASETELWENRPNEMRRLEAMLEYCKTNGCYRGKILDYFGEEHKECCRNCGNCLAEYETQDITVEAQKILSCIFRIRQKLGFGLGKNSVIDSLMGKKNAKIQSYGVENLSTYGLMKDQKRAYVEKIFEKLSDCGYIAINPTHKTAELGVLANGVLFGNKKVELPFKKNETVWSESKQNKPQTQQKPVYGNNEKLFEELRALRADIAEKENRPAFTVFSNASLADMVQKRPTNITDFLNVSGVGEYKAQKYGSAFIKIITEFENKENIQ